MKVEPSGIAGVELEGPDAASFIPAVETLYGRTVDDVLRPALPYSVIARNGTARTIALLGIRFDMVGATGKPLAVVHYADALRHPEKADLTGGAARFVCAEPAWSELVLRQGSQVDQRARMNLDNLRKVLSIRAAVDCVAFDNGQFAGPDSNRAYERLQHERLAETELIGEVLAKESLGEPALEAFLKHAMEVPARRDLARRLSSALQVHGKAELFVRTRAHCCRIPLWR